MEIDFLSTVHMYLFTPNPEGVEFYSLWEKHSWTFKVDSFLTKTNTKGDMAKKIINKEYIPQEPFFASKK